MVVGSGCAEAAQAAAKIAGVTKVLVADAPHLGDQLAENIAAQILAVAKDYTHILAPATANGKNVLPRVAAKLDVAQISDIVSVESADTFKRPIYAGNAIATVQSRGRDQGHHRAHHGVRRGRRPKAAARRWRTSPRWPIRASRSSSVAKSPRASGRN